MPDRDMLLSMAAACEQATGPDRELDASIAPTEGLRVVEEGHPFGRCCYDAGGRLTPIPRYTASLDAAMSLVQEGWFTSDFHQGPCGGNWWKLSTIRAGDTHYTSVAGLGKSAALALCAAALRARAHILETGNG